MTKPAPYDNGKIKIGLLWSPPPPPVDFDMEAIQKALCPPSKRIVHADFDAVVKIIEEGIVIACIVGVIAFMLYPNKTDIFFNIIFSKIFNLASIAAIATSHVPAHVASHTRT